MNQQFDHAAACFNALVGASGITAEAREIRNDDSIADEQALHIILEARFGHLSDREAYAACARRYGVELPAWPQQTDASGLESTDCTGVILGNTDLEASCDWLPPITDRPMAPLPDCYHEAALASIERAERNADGSDTYCVPVATMDALSASLAVAGGAA